jgi:hypothetical protein
MGLTSQRPLKDLSKTSQRLSLPEPLIHAPVDHHFGANLKSDVHLLFQTEFEKNIDG